MTVAAVKGLAQGAANSLNGAQDSFAHTGNLFLTYVNTVADVTDAFVGTPVDQRIRVPMIPLVDWSRGRFTAETDSDHSTSKTAGGFGFGVLGPIGYARLSALRNAAIVDEAAGVGQTLLAPVKRLTAPSPSARLLQLDLDHIVARHWPTSGATGAGKFAPDTTGKSLLDMIKKGVEKGVARPNTRNRPGTIYEFDFGRQIGVDMAGNIATRIRVIVRPDRTITTAFPF